MSKTIQLLCFALLFQTAAFSKDYILRSPDKKITINISVGKNITWSVLKDQELLIKPSAMRMILKDGINPGIIPVVSKTISKAVNQTIVSVIPVRNKLIPEVYNELRLQMKGNYAIEFRAYNDGVAYRFVTNLGPQPIEVNDEKVAFNFHENCQIYLPKEDNAELQSHYEGDFKPSKLQEIPAEHYGYLPLYVATPAGTKMVITEADLHDYPNLFLYGTGTKTLTGRFPKVILEASPKPNSDRAEVIGRKANYHAKTTGNRTFPWRTIIITSSDKELLENEMVYKLARPNILANTDWIKPGKVAWDWWNDNNIYGVNFKSGINTETYKYYIDFASAYGLEYIILDEGWSKSTTDLLAPNPQLDIEGLVKYATTKNVGVILWALWKPLDQHMEAILDQYVKWGVKGVKVDFMARADQYMVNFYERAAQETAKRKLLLDLHGAYKPVGLNREYPNVINYEGVKGMENNKWEETITPVHNTTLPFTRMVAGPMDYTPGAMLNSNKDEFHVSMTSPMSRGTRAHQTSMYVLYDSPLQMLCDNPSNYLREPVYTHYIARFPTVWDKTIALEGKISEYAVVARKNGNNWYIGGMTNWDARGFDIPLTFLDGKKYKIEILQDGINVGKHAADYQIISKEVVAGEILHIDMAAGGGYAAILTPIG
ncbi:alpha-glucosidase [Pedobacter cryoconitis]|uniref:Alpha-glucosidase n=1 Tax=Pedobacter cryoconitis TaxID=188932 RepID=A0A127VGX3_9SPHI|nr:glycoside hydrolase family 97 protein [Pedobacter cryoconitis]AMQ00613.1 alpha-glucosidase [Pedobacter cryoconitis]